MLTLRPAFFASIVALFVCAVDDFLKPKISLAAQVSDFVFPFFVFSRSFFHFIGAHLVSKLSRLKAVGGRGLKCLVCIL